MNSAFTYPTTDPEQYRQADPFPHAILRGSWHDDALVECKRQVLAFSEWDGEKDFYGSRRKRYCGNIEKLPPAVVSVIHEASSPRFLKWLEQLTGERSLLPDPYLEGGGIHQIINGGFLKIHADFNWNRKLSLFRRLNVLIYLNSGWNPDWGGALELWKPDMSESRKAVMPEMNTMVVFTTDDQSFHGHPHPIASPDGVTRDSIALYYYSAIEPRQNFARQRDSTDYRPIAGDDFAPTDESSGARAAAVVREPAAQKSMFARWASKWGRNAGS